MDTRITNMVDEILVNDFVEADKIFEHLMAERVLLGIENRAEDIQGRLAEEHPALFKQLDEVVDDSENDENVKADHQPVEADYSEQIPEPVEVDGHRHADYEDEVESEQVYEQIIVDEEEHDDEDDDEDDE